MKITEVRIKLEPDRDSREKLLGYASVVLDNALVIHDIKLIGQEAS